MSEPRRPAWTSQDLIACVDGPMEGQWFTASDWHERRQAAARMADLHQRPTAIDAYQATTHSIGHPHVHDVTGTVWTTRPAPESAAEAPGEVRVLVTGSRTWQAPREVTDALDEIRAGLALGSRMTVIHGANPRGVDAIAAAWAAQHADHHDGAVHAEAHPADWRTHGRAAGMIRNTDMIRAGADLCLAFIRDHSPGATHCASTAHTAGIPTHTRTETTHETSTTADDSAELAL